MAQPMDIRETHAFKAALSEEVAKHTETLASQVSELRTLIEQQQKSAVASVPAPTDMVGVKAIMEHLGMTLADISAQGVGVQKPIPPEVIRGREEAHRRMISLIKRAKRDGEMPKYRVVADVQLRFGRQGEGLVKPFWIDSDKVRQPTEIEWNGQPNMAMRPLNAVAEEIYTAFKDSIGNMGRNGQPMQTEVETGEVIVHGAPEMKGKRNAPMPFDVSPDGDGVRVLHKQAKGQVRRVNILGTVHEPAEVSG